MPTLQDAHQRFPNAYQSLFDLIAEYPVERREQGGACGVWTPKQVIDHLSGWIVEANRRYDNYDAGDTTPVRYDFDTFNAGSVDARAEQSWSASEAEVRQRAADFQQRAQSVDPESPLIERYAGWLDILGEDCEEHTEQLHAFADPSSDTVHSE